MKKVIGIDLGGTNVKGLLMLEDGTILKSLSIPTNDQKEADWKLGIKTVYEQLIKYNEDKVEVVGLSAPGLANKENSAIEFLPGRLLGLENCIWGEYLGCQTYVLNDAHAATMAEVKFGVLKDYKNAIMLTLGTGVGGGIMLNGELHQGLFQRAGHMGHVSINESNTELSILGMPGSLEFALGNYSIATRSVGRWKSTKELVAAYEKGDTFATWLWLDSVRSLAIAISSFVNTFSPEAIAIAGGVVFAGDALFAPLKDFVSVYEFNPYRRSTPILKSAFDDQAGALGAGAFALSKI